MFNITDHAYQNQNEKQICLKTAYGNLLFLKNYYYYYFLNFWLHWVFFAACGLSLVVASGGYSCCGARASHCSGFFCAITGSRQAGFSSCSMQA